jgi:hypothetical protein
LDHINNDENFLKSIITGDKTWVYSYDVKTKAQSSKWVSKTSPRLKKHSKFGQMWSWCWLFFYCQGFVHHAFLPRGQTVNKENCPQEAVRRKRPNSWREKMNAPPWQHSYTFITYLWLSPKVQDHNHSTNSIPARPCTSRLIFFPEAAIYTEGQCFEYAENIPKNSLMELYALPQKSSQQWFQNCKIVLRVEWGNKAQ